MDNYSGNTFPRPGHFHHAPSHSVPDVPRNSGSFNTTGFPGTTNAPPPPYNDTTQYKQTNHTPQPSYEIQYNDNASAPTYNEVMLESQPLIPNQNQGQYREYKPSYFFILFNVFCFFLFIFFLIVCFFCKKTHCFLRHGKLRISCQKKTRFHKKNASNQKGRKKKENKNKNK